MMILLAGELLSQHWSGDPTELSLTVRSNVGELTINSKYLWPPIMYKTSPFLIMEISKTGYSDMY